MHRIGKCLKKPKIISISFLLISHIVIAQESTSITNDFFEDNSQNPEIEFNIGRGKIEREQQLVEDFKVLDEKVLKKEGLEKLNYMKSLSDSARIRVTPKTRYNWSVESIEELKEMGLHKAMLKAGSIIFSLDMEGVYEVKRDVFVNVIHGVDDKGFAYILTINNKVRFKTDYSNLVNIKAVTKLEVPPDRFKAIRKSELKGPYIPKKEFETEKKAFYQEFSVQYLTKTSNSLELINGKDSNESIESGSGFGLQYQGFFDFNFWTMFGFTLEFNQLAATSNLNEYEHRQMALGPLFNFQIGNLFERKLLAQLGASVSVFNNVIQTQGSQNSEIEYSAQTIFAGIRAYYPAAWGDLLLGANYALERSNPEQGQLSQDGVDEVTSDVKISFSLGTSW